MVTEEQCVREFADVIAVSDATCAQMTPREQAEAAYTPTGPSVDELEDRIRADRGMPALDRARPAEEGGRPVEARRNDGT